MPQKSIELTEGPRVAWDVKTAQFDFLDANPEGDKLFSVRAGVPVSDALDQLTVLLSAGKSAVEDVCATVSGGDMPQSQWAASQLLELSYALVQSIHQGLLDHDKTAASHGG